MWLVGCPSSSSSQWHAGYRYGELRIGRSKNWSVIVWCILEPYACCCHFQTIATEYNIRQGFFCNNCLWYLAKKRTAMHYAAKRKCKDLCNRCNCVTIVLTLQLHCFYLSCSNNLFVYPRTGVCLFPRRMNSLHHSLTRGLWEREHHAPIRSNLGSACLANTFSVNAHTRQLSNRFTAMGSTCCSTNAAIFPGNQYCLKATSCDCVVSLSYCPPACLPTPYCLPPTPTLKRTRTA